MAHSMVGKKKVFFSSFQTDVRHSILEFHCILQQQVLCVKSCLTSPDNVMALVTKIVKLLQKVGKIDQYPQSLDDMAFKIDAFYRHMPTLQ